MIWKMMKNEDIVQESAHDSESKQEYDSEQVDDDVHSEDKQDDNQTTSSNTTSSENCFIGRDKKTIWSKICLNRAARTRSENIIRGEFSVVRNRKTAEECFDIFFDEVIITSIIRYTNQRLVTIRDLYDDQHKYTVKVDAAELRAFLGLLFLSGVYKRNRLNLEDLWKTNSLGIDIFRRVMSLQRFQLLLRCLRFDNSENRQIRLQIDKFTHIRALFTKFVENCQGAYSPTEYVTIGEQLPAFRVRCPFRVYVPNKLSKYGLKIFALVDAKAYHVVNMEPYAGEQQDGRFKVSYSPFDVLDRLVAPISQTNRNVTFDNWFTSFPLLTHLLKNHILGVGTIRKIKLSFHLRL
ncbi:hypothetical protein HHI36_017126 [Cryptolaemus montrouzieri]|uniref:PiggyBac transposable element-derived protein domain-containing protein n=1 Tax=Cryptolaemus montrouzieri TaxID=559131 RepID=A0ABD2NLL9_9CUCU